MLRFDAIVNWPQDFSYRLRMTWGLVKVYWPSVIDGDWSTIGEIMRYEIGRQGRAIQKHGWMEDECYLEMLEVERILTRMLNEGYYDEASLSVPEHGKEWADLVTKLEGTDMDRLGELMKHLRFWWD